MVQELAGSLDRDADSPRMLSGSNPIDHIFQFHKALRRDLLRLEADAARFSAAVHASTDGSDPAIIAKVGSLPDSTLYCTIPVRHVCTSLPYLNESLTHVSVQMIQQLEGRFQFMWGLYRAHSLSEDEIVFPALEVQMTLSI